MPKKPVIDHEEKESLVPSISREEDRLQSYLETASREARQIIKDAEQSAAERTRRAREALPTIMEQRRAGILAESSHRAEKLRFELASRTADALKRAEENCQEAASLVVREVWPGDPG